MMPMHVWTMMNHQCTASVQLRAINWSRSSGPWGGNLFLRLGGDKDSKHSWWGFSFWSGTIMVGSFNDINGSTDQILPQEDPRSKKFSGQYDYSLHSVPIKISHQIQSSKKLSQVGKHHKHKRRHRRSKKYLFKKFITRNFSNHNSHMSTSFAFEKKSEHLICL